MAQNTENSGTLPSQRAALRKLGRKQASLDLGVPMSAFKRGAPKSQRVALSGKTTTAAPRHPRTGRFIKKGNTD